MDFYMESMDRLPNLQLLESIPNQEKSDSSLKLVGEDSALADPPSRFLCEHLIPDRALSLGNFQGFFTGAKNATETEAR